MPVPYATLNATTMLEVFAYANTVTGTWFWSMILASIFIITFGVLKVRNTMTDTLVASSWLSAILGMMLFVLSLISYQTLLIFLVLALGSAINLIMKKRNR